MGGRGGGGFCQNAERGVHQGLDKQRAARGKLGFVPTLELATSSLIADWLNPPPPQPRVPKGQQLLCQPSSPGQPDSPPLTTLLSLRSHPLDSSLIHDTLLTASFPGVPRDFCSELSGRESYSETVSRCHISSQRRWKQYLNMVPLCAASM